MPIPIRTLKVHPNPYVGDTIDHLGRPAGRVKCDYYEHSKTGFVGAVLTDFVEVSPAIEHKIDGRSFSVVPAQHDHRVAYSRVAVEIPNTAYYRDAIKRGDLFAADVKTFVAAGGAAAQFVDPAKALAAARDAEIARFNAATGDDAHAEMGAFEPLWIGDEEPALKPAFTTKATGAAKTADSAKGAS